MRMAQRITTFAKRKFIQPVAAALLDAFQATTLPISTRKNAIPNTRHVYYNG